MHFSLVHLLLTWLPSSIHLSVSLTPPLFLSLFWAYLFIPDLPSSPTIPISCSQGEVRAKGSKIGDLQQVPGEIGWEEAVQGAKKLWSPRKTEERAESAPAAVKEDSTLWWEKVSNSVLATVTFRYCTGLRPDRVHPEHWAQSRPSPSTALGSDQTESMLGDVNYVNVESNLISEATKYSTFPSVAPRF